LARCDVLPGCAPATSCHAAAVVTPQATPPWSRGSEMKDFIWGESHGLLYWIRRPTDPHDPSTPGTFTLSHPRVGPPVDTEGRPNSVTPWRAVQRAAWDALAQWRTDHRPDSS
jgi:hypothetical protein